jgi:sulfate adenylyltransferase subunit 1 (EFTu-like GTPase family)
VATAPFMQDRRGGALIVIDPRSGETVAAGGVLSA